MRANKLFKMNMAGTQGVFLRTNRDNPKLCFGGHVYMKHRAHNFLVIWRRTRKSCRGRVVATPSGLVVEERMPHGHEASQLREEHSRVRAQMKGIATTGQIYHAPKTQHWVNTVNTP